MRPFAASINKVKEGESREGDKKKGRQTGRQVEINDKTKTIEAFIHRGGKKGLAKREGRRELWRE